MTNFRYTLDTSSKKYSCPNCGKKRFVKYIDNETGDYIDEKYGRCDREAECAYWNKPYFTAYNKPSCNSSNINQLKQNTENIPMSILENTMNYEGYNYNVFLNNLLNNTDFPFEIQDILKIISFYKLGTIMEGYRKGAITFPFIDFKNMIRAIQVKEFNESNHTIGTDFIHSILNKQNQTSNLCNPQWLNNYLANDKKVSCLFGEHLLCKYETNPIALVEAPKSAIYGTLYFGFPENPNNMLWLGVYNLSSLNHEKCKILKGRDVHLFPDLSKDGSAFRLWKKRAQELEHIIPRTRFTVSTLLEDNANEKEREQGLDIADILIKQDWRKYRTHDQHALGNNSEESPSCEQSEISAKEEETFFSSRHHDEQKQYLSPTVEEKDT